MREVPLEYLEQISNENIPSLLIHLAIADDHIQSMYIQNAPLCEQIGVQVLEMEPLLEKIKVLIFDEIIHSIAVRCGMTSEALGTQISWNNNRTESLSEINKDLIIDIIDICRANKLEGIHLREGQRALNRYFIDSVNATEDMLDQLIKDEWDSLVLAQEFSGLVGDINRWIVDIDLKEYPYILEYITKKLQDNFINERIYPLDFERIYYLTIAFIDRFNIDESTVLSDKVIYDYVGELRSELGVFERILIAA